MKPEHWKQIDEILDAAFELAPDKRAAFLAQACAGDEDLRKEIEVLLASDERMGSFIEVPALETAAAAEVLANLPRGLSPGQSVGPYTILSAIAAGGMGEVYRAQDPRIGREVAIKLLPARFSQNEQRLHRFEQEVRAVGMLNHPNILTIYDVGRENGSPYLVTELLQGQTFRERLAAGSIPIQKAIDYALQIVQGLSAAHEKGIIHRDLKPENLFLTKEDRVKVLDFGLAKLIQHEISAVDIVSSPTVSRKTETGVVLGTLLYMSPEQIRGGKVDHRSDIFAFGSVLYEMLSGRQPFQGESQLDVIHAILTSDPPRLALTNSQITAALEGIVRRCLEKEPDHRFQSSKDLAFALETLSKPASAEENTFNQLLSRIGGRGTLIGAVILILLSIVIFANWNRLLRTEPKIREPEPFHKMKISRLTTSGNIYDAAISPDGKYVAYVIKDGEVQSLWVRQVATTSNVLILPPAAVRFEGVTFSMDGNFIYYVVCPLDNPQGTAYQIPVLGGSVRRLFDDVYSPIAVSPDSKFLAFVGNSGLMISQAGGNGIGRLATPKAGNTFEGSPAWSPDGKTIVVVSGDLAGYQDHLISVQLDSGEQRPVNSQKWFDIQRVSWLSDGSGFVLVAKENGNEFRDYQVWYVSYPEGKVARITNDLNEYRGLSLTVDSSTMISVRLEQTSNIWVVGDRDSEPRRITNGSGSLDGLWGISWTADGRIVYTSIASGSEDLWLMTSDGGNKKQLTAGEMAKIAPSCCLNGGYAVFMSRGGKGSHIWRIGMDGSGLKQLTDGAYQGVPNCTPDGRWVIYVSPGAGKWKLWKISIDGREAVQLTDSPSLSPAASPDGKLIAYTYLDDKHQKNIAIILAEGGPPIRTFPLSPTVLLDVGIGLRWTRDAQALAYVDIVNDASNIWIQPLDGGLPKQLTNFKSDEIFSYDLSQTGQIAVTRGTLTRDVVLIRDFR